MIFSLPSVAWLLLVLVCLWFWPGTSPLPRLVVVAVVLTLLYGSFLLYYTGWRLCSLSWLLLRIAWVRLCYWFAVSFLLLKMHGEIALFLLTYALGWRHEHEERHHQREEEMDV